jgi:hypothetical protein
VDRFVVYDDVAFIKQGWINRNRILVEGKPHGFSVPLRGASSFRCIDETLVDPDAYHPWWRKFSMTIDQSYGRAPHFAAVRTVLHESFEGFAGSIAALALRSLVRTTAYLGIDTPITASSRRYGNQHLKGAERVIDICLREGAGRYVNAIGGRKLYSPEPFADQEISIHFLEPALEPYRQFTSAFVPDLSVIDVMMFNPPDRIRDMLRQYQLR